MSFVVVVLITVAAATGKHLGHDSGGSLKEGTGPVFHQPWKVGPAMALRLRLGLRLVPVVLQVVLLVVHGKVVILGIGIARIGHVGVVVPHLAGSAVQLARAVKRVGSCHGLHPSRVITKRKNGVLAK